MNYSQPNKITTHVKEVKRTMAENTFSILNHPSMKKSIINVSQKLISEGNLQGINSDSVVRIIKSETIAQWNRDADDIVVII